MLQELVDLFLEVFVVAINSYVSSESLVHPGQVVFLESRNTQDRFVPVELYEEVLSDLCKG